MSNVLYDPVLDLSVEVSNLERELIDSFALNRLRYISHRGASFALPHLAFSRFEHVLGVFQLIAHFEPDNYELRAAALLHDIGHPAFCHTLEAALQLNHYAKTVELLHSAAISKILVSYGISTQRVIELINGERPNILRNLERKAHCDHLDGYIRGAVRSGYPSEKVKKILGNISSDGCFLRFNEVSGPLLAELIWLEADYQFSTENIKIQAMLEKLLIKHASLDSTLKSHASTMIDAEVLSLLMNNPVTRQEMHKLLFEHQNIQIERNCVDIPVDAYKFSAYKIYDNGPAFDVEWPAFDNVHMQPKREVYTQRLGDYFLWWK